MSASASIDLDLPVEQAWRAITAWSDQGLWMPMTTVDVVEGDGGLGTKLRARTGVGPLAVVDDMTIDVWQPPHRAEVAHHGKVVTGRGVFAVDPLPDDRSRITWIEQPSATSVLSKMGAVTNPVTGAILGVALRRLRPIAERLG